MHQDFLVLDKNSIDDRVLKILHSYFKRDLFGVLCKAQTLMG